MAGVNYASRLRVHQALRPGTSSGKRQRPSQPCARGSKKREAKRRVLVYILFKTSSSDDSEVLTSECPTGLRGNIRLELSEKKLEPGVKAGNASTVSLADTGITLQYFDTVTAQAGATGYDPGFPFELVAGGSRDNGSLVTLSGDSGTNGSVMASA